MDCAACGKPLPDLASFCSHCGQPSASPAPAEAHRPDDRIEGTAYAGMGTRLLAFVVDVAIVGALVSVFAVAAGRAGYAQAYTAYADYWVVGIWVAYMALFEIARQRTPGKALFGLRVASDQVEPRVHAASAGKILLRETVGRFLGSMIFFLGYWFANNQPQRQAWTDMLADTVVLQERNTRLRSVVIACACVVLLVVVYGDGFLRARGVQQRQALTARVVAANQTMQIAAAEINQTEALSATSADELRQNMAALLPLLDGYDQAVAAYTQAAAQGLASGALSNPGGQVARYLAAIGQLRRQQSADMRHEAQWVLAADRRQSLASLSAGLQPMEQAVAADNAKMQTLAASFRSGMLAAVPPASR